MSNAVAALIGSIIGNILFWMIVIIFKKEK